MFVWAWHQVEDMGLGHVSVLLLEPAGQLGWVPLMVMTEAQEDRPHHTSVLPTTVCVMSADILLQFLSKSLRQV